MFREGWRLTRSCQEFNAATPARMQIGMFIWASMFIWMKLSYPGRDRPGPPISDWMCRNVSSKNWTGVLFFAMRRWWMSPTRCSRALMAQKFHACFLDLVINQILLKHSLGFASNPRPADIWQNFQAPVSHLLQVLFGHQEVQPGCFQPILPT